MTAEHAEATQTRYPIKAILRTFVQVILGGGAILALATPQILAYLQSIGASEDIYGWFVGALGALAATVALFAGLFAIPKVNDFLTKYLGLGATPKNAIVSSGQIESTWTRDEIRERLRVYEMKAGLPDGQIADKLDL